MPSYQEHLKKSNDNLLFLEKIKEFDNYFDWKVTVTFYSALHLINAHIANKINEHYRSHNKVEIAINPYNELSPTKLSEEVYKSYIKLQNLSRRSRYLVSDSLSNVETRAFFTYDKHFKKALRHLDNVILFFEKEYNVKIIKIKLPKEVEIKDVKSFSFI